LVQRLEGIVTLV